MKRLVLNESVFLKYRYLYLYKQQIHSVNYVRNKYEKEWGYEPLKEKNIFHVPKNVRILKIDLVIT